MLVIDLVIHLAKMFLNKCAKHRASASKEMLNLKKQNRAYNGHTHAKHTFAIN